MRILAAATVVIMAAQPRAQEPAGEPVDLRHDNCGQTEVLISSLQDVRIAGRCDPAGLVLHLAVENLEAAKNGILLEFDLGFCGRPVMGTSEPPGWVAAVTESDGSQSVTWQVTNPDGTSQSRRLEGFSVELTSAWVRNRSAGVRWNDRVAATETTHDCP